MGYMINWNRNIRRAIGFIALAFPFVLALTGLFDGAWTETSLSATYWSNSGVLFSGMLIMFSVFLFAYEGYDKTDYVLTNIAALAMLMVAMFPCEGGDVYLFSFISSEATNIIHYITAGITFSMLGVMSIFQFTKYRNYMTENKKKRNLIYRICGVVIFTAIGLMLLVELIPGFRRVSDSVRFFYWLESIVVWAFGVSWLVKGRFLLTD